jgi:hypothetical protein
MVMAVKLARVKKMRPEPGLDPEPIQVIDLAGIYPTLEYDPITKSLQTELVSNEPVKAHLTQHP